MFGDIGQELANDCASADYYAASTDSISYSNLPIFEVPAIYGGQCFKALVRLSQSRWVEKYLSVYLTTNNC